MKKLIIILVACIIGTSHFSFSQEPIYNWGAPSTNEDLNKKIDQVLSLDDNGFIVLRKHTDHMFVNHYSIETYDANLSLLEVNPINFNGGVMGDSYFIEDVQVANGKVYAFITHWLKSAGTHEVILNELKLTGEIVEIKVLDTINGKKLGNKGMFSMSFSPDGSKLAVLSEQPFIKKTNEKLRLKCFNVSGAEELWSQGQELAWASKRAANNYISVNNDGVVMLFKKRWEKPVWNYEVYAASGDQWKKYDGLGLDGKEIEDFQMTVDPKGSIGVYGLYASDHSAFERKITGSCFFQINSNLDLIFSKVNNNDQEMLAYFVGEKKAAAGKGFISNLAIKDILYRKDGNTMVLLEQQKEDKSPIVGSSPIQYTYEFIYSDFLTLNLTPSGDLVWWQAFSKNQKVVNNSDTDEYGSYVYYLKNDRLHILWNNTNLSVPSIPAAFWKEPDGTKYIKHKAFNDKTMHATFMEIIEPDGGFAYGDRTFGLPLFNLHAGAVFEMSMNTNFTMDVNNDLVIMASMHNGGKRYRFGFVGL